MTTENPYESPRADTYVINAEEERQGGELASRWARLGAMVIDITLLLLIYTPAKNFLADLGIIVNPDAVEITEGFFDYIITLVLGWAIFILVNSYFIMKNGQTIGKKILKIKVVLERNSKHDFWNYIIYRQLVLDLITMIPYLGHWIFLLSFTLIFGKNKKCLHDYLGRTNVIYA